ncbi:hypothetical protein CSW37_06275, partial [Thermus scotoductus]
MAQLLVENITLTFGGVAALSSVSLAVEEGELVSVIGPNGAGKTSLLYPFLLYSSSMTVADHLTLNELWRRVKKAKDPIEKHRFLAVYH